MNRVEINYLSYDSDPMEAEHVARTVACAVKEEISHKISGIESAKGLRKRFGRVPLRRFCRRTAPGRAEAGASLIAECAEKMEAQKCIDTH